MKKVVWSAACLQAAALLIGHSAAYAQGASRLADLSIEDLLKVEVTSVSRKAQELMRSAAAIYVITDDDIRRSGATTLPDVLRMAPGVSVAELSTNTWAIATRGFGGVHTNKLLVLIDGRSVYDPLSGGVNWEAQLLPLDAIEHVEVIRGPGGSLWGANAVNGVINIITKTADQRQGARLATRVSRYEPGSFSLSYGDTVGSARYVVEGRLAHRDTPGLVLGYPEGDDRRAGYAGTRIDWSRGADTLSLQFDAEHGEGRRVEQTLTLTAPFRQTGVGSTSFDESSANFTWQRAHSSRAESTLQVYYAGGRTSDLGERHHTFDAQARHHRAIGGRHDLVAGVETRYVDSAVRGTPLVRLTPVDSDTYVLTPFVQDEIAISRSFTVTAGVKGGHENIPGIELQPSLRALWMLSPRQSVWGSVTRVVRTPNRFERGMHIVSAASPGQGPLPFVVTLEGSPDRTFESVVGVETGYRAQSRRASLDVTGFAGEYFNLAQMQRGTPAPATELGTPVVRLPLTSVGNGHADARGVETAVTWKPAGPWQIAGNYSVASVEFEDSKGASASAVPVNGPTPAQQFHARTFVDVTPRLQVGALFYRTLSIPKIDIAAITRLDAQATWSLSDRVKVTAGARGLLHGDRIEYRDTLTNVVPTPVRANPYVGVTWGF